MSSAAGHGSAGGPSSARSERATRRASSGSAAGRPASSRAVASTSAVVDRGPGQAQLGGARAVDALAEQRHGRRRLALAGAAQQDAVAAARVQADLQEAGHDLGVGGHHAQVGGEGQVHPAPTAPPRMAATVGGSSSPTRANDR